MGKNAITGSVALAAVGLFAWAAISISRQPGRRQFVNLASEPHQRGGPSGGPFGPRRTYPVRDPFHGVRLPKGTTLELLAFNQSVPCRTAPVNCVSPTATVMGFDGRPLTFETKFWVPGWGIAYNTVDFIVLTVPWDTANNRPLCVSDGSGIVHRYSRWVAGNIAVFAALILSVIVIGAFRNRPAFWAIPATGLLVFAHINLAGDRTVASDSPCQFRSRIDSHRTIDGHFLPVADYRIVAPYGDQKGYARAVSSNQVSILIVGAMTALLISVALPSIRSSRRPRAVTRSAPSPDARQDRIPEALPEFTVMPLDVPLPPEVDSEVVGKQWQSPPDVGCVYWVAGIVLFFLSSSFGELLAKKSGHGTWAILPIVSILGTLATYRLHGHVFARIKRLKQLETLKASRETEIARLLSAARREASETSKLLRSLLAEEPVLRASAIQSLASASASIESADRAFRDRRFEPFWNLVDDAHWQISAYGTSVRDLSIAARHYSEALSQRQHSFPPFPKSAGDIPTAGALPRRLRSLVHQAEAQFEFASIRLQQKLLSEERRTRRTHEEGFRSMIRAQQESEESISAALASVDSTLEDHLIHLHRELAVVTQAVVETAAQDELTKERHHEDSRRILERQDQKLDDIRRKRKP